MSAVAIGLLLGVVTAAVTQDSSITHQHERANITLNVESNVPRENDKTKTIEEKYFLTETNNSSFKEIINANNTTTVDEYAERLISLESNESFSNIHYEEDGFENLTYQVEANYNSEEEDLLLGSNEDGLEKIKNNGNITDENFKYENNTNPNPIVNNTYSYFPNERVKRHLDKENEFNYTNAVNDVLREEVLQTIHLHSQVNKTSNSNGTADYNGPWTELEYTEEDISVGAQVDEKMNTDGLRTNSFHWPPDIQELDEVPNLHSPRFLPSINSAELYLPSTCLIEWEECKMDAECCRPFYCSTIPKFPVIDSLSESSSLEVIQACSRFKTNGLKHENQTHLQQLLDSYKRKMMEVAKS